MRWKICLVLVLASFAVYSQVGGFDFVNFDDPDYVAANTHVRNGLTPEGIEWAFQSGEAANWFPATWISHMVDCQFFGLRSGFHHLTNVLLHALAAVLLFAFLDRATRATWPSAFVAFAFALHPLHVESVAWVAERKDVLNAVFWFLTLWCYVRYTERPQLIRYLVVVASFCVGLMSKPMIVTLPCVLLLLDYWPLRRGVRWREKIPLFALSGAAAAITYLVQRNAGAVESLAIHPIGLRVENALVTYVVYIARTFWPVKLAVFYPYPAGFPVWQVAGAILVLAAISGWAWRLRGSFAVGWLWYLGTLIPVIGLVQVGGQARADRYMYVPMVGLAVMLAWSLPSTKPVAVGSIAAVAACSAVTWLQVSYWRNSETLFQHAIEVTSPNYIAEHNLGSYLLDRPGRLPEAVTHLQAALRIEPNSPKAHSDLGNALAKMPDRLPDAVREYRAALRIEPNSAIPHNNLGNALSRIPGRLPEAVEEYRTALRIEPNYAEAHNNLGSALAQMGQMPAAVAEWQAADTPEARRNLELARAAPDAAEAAYDAAVAFVKAGRLPEAVAQFEESLRIKPNYAEAHNNLGVAMAEMGRSREAIAQFREALRIRPDYADARENLGIALNRR